MAPTAKTLADRARSAHAAHPDWGATQIAEHIGTSRQNVEQALTREHDRRGRPRSVRVLALPVELLERAAMQAKRAGMPLRAFVAAAIDEAIKARLR